MPGIPKKQNLWEQLGKINAQNWTGQFRNVPWFPLRVYYKLDTRNIQHLSALLGLSQPLTERNAMLDTKYIFCVKDDLVYLQFMRSNFPFKNLNGCVRKRSFCDTNIYVIDIFLTCSCSEKELSSMPSFNQVMWGLLIRLLITRIFHIQVVAIT